MVGLLLKKVVKKMNRVVLVTGSRRGIGLATAKKFAENGYDIVLNNREESDLLEKIKHNIEEKYKVKVFTAIADISKEDEVIRMCNEIKEKIGNIDVLVNNAGIVYDMELEERTVEIFNQTINNNLTGTFIMCKHIGKMMMDKKHGVIINVSSTNGINSYFPTSIDYDASKAGIISLTHNFALAYAPYIRVNAIAPGWVNTDMNKDLPKELVQKESEKIYLKRFAEPEEIANLIYFLASPDASYINNAIIKIDGGY